MEKIIISLIIIKITINYIIENLLLTVVYLSEIC